MLKQFLAFIFVLSFIPACSAQNLVEPYQEGVHYFKIDNPQPNAGDKVQVVEVFSYACVHCAHFQAQVDEWKKRMPAQASFSYLPAAWSPPWEMMARAYYTAEAFGLLEKTHMAFFNTLHIEHKAFASMNDVAQWYAQYGVKAEDFLKTTTSFAVETKINQSKQLTAAYGVDGTPSIVVAGKYRVTGDSAKGYDKLFDVVDFLVAKEAAGKKPN